VKGMAEAQDGPEAEPIDARIHRQRLRQRATAGRLYEMPKPTIAALPGAAVGAGLSLALTQDHREAVQALVEKRTPQFVGR
jgi:2-(1,2-epoxy-1,2-dihydrophenyl)acetyl-CoA isomerase